MQYTTVRAIVRFVMRIIARVEVRGRENLPEGNFILAANHLGRLDTAVLLCAVDREDIIMPVAEKYREHPLFGMLGRSINAIWLNRFEVDYAALREILKRMERGGLMVIFTLKFPTVGDAQPPMKLCAVSPRCFPKNITACMQIIRA